MELGCSIQQGTRRGMRRAQSTGISLWHSGRDAGALCPQSRNRARKQTPRYTPQGLEDDRSGRGVERTLRCAVERCASRLPLPWNSHAPEEISNGSKTRVPRGRAHQPRTHPPTMADGIVWDADGVVSDTVSGVRDRAGQWRGLLSYQHEQLRGHTARDRRPRP